MAISVAATSLTFGLVTFPLGVLVGMGIIFAADGLTAKNNKKIVISVGVLLVAGVGILAFTKAAKQKQKLNNFSNNAQVDITKRRAIENRVIFDKEKCEIKIPFGCNLSAKDFRFSNDFKRACDGKVITANGLKKTPDGSISCRVYF